MNIGSFTRTTGLLTFTLTLSSVPVMAQQLIVIDLASETVGAESTSFLSVVGNWRVEQDANQKVLAVDCRQWKEGQSSVVIADKARALYADRYAEFLDRVQAYAYFPYAVAKDVADFKGGEISVHFEGISGREDQGAGILFNLKPNGDYLTIRANALENNLVLWKFEKGKRSSSNGFGTRRRPAASGMISRCESRELTSKAISTASSILNTRFRSPCQDGSAFGPGLTVMFISRVIR